jgi:hypothetical protein
MPNCLSSYGETSNSLDDHLRITKAVAIVTFAVGTDVDAKIMGCKGSDQ